MRTDIQLTNNEIKEAIKDWISEKGIRLPVNTQVELILLVDRDNKTSATAKIVVNT